MCRTAAHGDDFDTRLQGQEFGEEETCRAADAVGQEDDVRGVEGWGFEGGARAEARQGDAVAVGGRADDVLVREVVPQDFAVVEERAPGAVVEVGPGIEGLVAFGVEAVVVEGTGVTET